MYVSLFQSCTGCILHISSSVETDTFRCSAAFIVLDGKSRLRKVGALAL